eukprot:349475_1
MRSVTSTVTSNSDDIEWLIQNQHCKDFWDRKSSLEYEHRKILRNRLKNSIKIKHIPQQTYQKVNTKTINEIYDNYLLEDSQLLNILQTCIIIQQERVPIPILSVIILYIGNGKISISYTASILPFFHINEPTLKKWWYEIQNTVDHRGIFIPQNIKTAAKEFDLYITERLNRDLSYYKYKNLMIPTINILPINLTNKFHAEIVKKDNNYGISLTLPTQGHKEVGGIEMFQRLYLEAAFKKPDLDAFYVDLAQVNSCHGDNWCVGGNGVVLMANGTKKLVSQLNVGDKVRSFPNCVATVECVIISNINDCINMVRLNGNGWITVEHPMLISNVNNSLCECGMDLYETYKGLNGLDSDEIKKYNLRWVLPTDIGVKQKRYVDKIYNFVLDSYHTINVNGFWCLTLGDGYKGDIIGHEFWSNHDAILTFLKKQPTFPYVVFE